MEELKLQIKEAWVFIDKTCYEYVQGDITVTKEEEEIIKKFVKLDLITYVKKKKGDWQEKLYFPTLQAKCCKGLSIQIWLRMMQEAVVKHGIPSKISKYSANDYLSKAYEYDLKPSVVSLSYVEKADRTKEQLCFEQVLEEEL